MAVASDDRHAAARWMTMIMALTAAATLPKTANGFAPALLRRAAPAATFGHRQQQPGGPTYDRKRFSAFRSSPRSTEGSKDVVATDYPATNGWRPQGNGEADHAQSDHSVREANLSYEMNSKTSMSDFGYPSNSTPAFQERAFSTANANTNTNTNATGMEDVHAPSSPKQLATDIPSTIGANEEAAYLSIDPSDVEIVSLPPPSGDQSSVVSPEIMHQIPFVSMFRGSAKYIANHRNTQVVFHIPGELIVDNPTDVDSFRDLMDDIALTWLLGMKICIVVGCRQQIESRLAGDDTRPCHHGIKVTDAHALRVVKEEAGYVKFEVERQLARSLRMHGSDMVNGSDGKQRKVEEDGSKAKQDGPSMQGYFGGNVVSGNFYSAQPIGILDGVDFEYSGFVRKVEAERIRQVHQSRDIVLLSTLGVSPSGEVFNVNSENLAATVAGAMGASKIVFFDENNAELRHKQHGVPIQNLRVAEGKKLLELNDVRIQKRGFDYLGTRAPADPSIRGMLIKIGWSIDALNQGVKRAHIISPTDGALLQELYTRDGAGTMISRDLYDGIRPAKVEDVTAIHDLIQPLVATGTLVDRSRSVLERTIDNYHLYLRDGLVIACGQVKMYEDGFAEIACLVVNPAYRSQGRGDAMLGYLERLCLRRGATEVFVLSTQTMEWFIERGFKPVKVDRLPPSRQAQYNYSRNSKIYMKKIDSERDLDAAELWWNR